jgi:hypothetical protein
MRSLPLQALIPLFELSSIQYFALPLDGKEEIERCCLDSQLLDPYRFLPPDSLTYQSRADMGATAALLSQLDLVLTCDTSVAHLAGALGVKTLLWLSFIPDWRWGLQGEKTKWYPSLTLLRQQTRGSWKEVIEQTKIYLQALPL